MKYATETYNMKKVSIFQANKKLNYMTETGHNDHHINYKSNT